MSWLGESDHAVLGATLFSCLKKRNELPGFGLVVIDEASQVRVPEAAAAVKLVAGKCRLVLAGDHLQLPPIVAGVYPATPPGEPVLHRRQPRRVLAALRMLFTAARRAAGVASADEERHACVA